MSAGRMNTAARLAASVLCALTVLTAAVCLGSSGASVGDVANVLAHRLFGAELTVSDSAASIIWSLRLPRVLLAFLAGACLGTGGAALQSSLGNPLASPYTMGVSSGAALGAGAAIIAGVSSLSPLLPAVGIACAVVSIAVVMGFSAGLDRSLKGNTVILTGMVYSLFASAILTTLSAMYSEDMRQITLWQLGSFSLRGYDYPAILAFFALVGIGGLLLRSHALDVLTQGDETASGLGVSVSREKALVFALSSLLCGATVSLCGVIGFVDIIAPHIARRIFGSRHSVLIPAAAIIGGALMVAADLAARMAMPGRELPVGAVTALIGAPFFAFVYFSGRGKHR